MARDESQREDLLREATALVERIELVPHCDFKGSVGDDSKAERIVAGFRANGALSLFFGEDPVYQFNAAGELRRAFVSGKLIKAARGQLIALERVRQLHQVELRRHDLTAEDQSAFLSGMGCRIREFEARLGSGNYTIAGQVPQDADVIGRIQRWLADRIDWPIAATPRV